MAPDRKPPRGHGAPELEETIADLHSSGAKVAAGTLRFQTGDCFAGRYDIFERLGAGAMGEVYRAHDRHVGDTIALKIIASVKSTALVIERFRQEVRLARRIGHKNVARIYDLGEHEGTLFLSMEYIKGLDLDQMLLDRGRFPIEELLRIGIEITKGLEAAHGVGVIHRDLKPANIMREAAGRIIITDFGIAVTSGEEAKDTGEVMGSPAYMAPEQLEGAAPDLRSDLFSLGVILYQLASNTFPFTGKTPIKMAMARLDSPPLPLADDLGLPPALVRIIMRCLERDPANRPANAAALRKELEPLASPASSAGGVADTQVESPAPRATMLRDDPTVRVRCFRYRGPDATSYMGEGIAEELIDTLSRTRGLRVIAGAETTDEAPTNQEGAQTLIVSGTVERQGNRFRIVARLVNARTETQLWSDSFLAEFADLFAAQERIAQRVAEALRLEFDTAAVHDRIPQESVELYLRARQQVRLDKYLGDDGAIALLDESLKLAPGLRPAIAWRALATARSFWDSRVPSGLSLADAQKQVTIALEQATSQAESHLAAAILAGQAVDYAETVKHLTNTLAVAPTCGTAHYYLGEMQCHTGRLVEGEERLRLSLHLDPSLRYVEFNLLRLEAFRGNWEPVEKALAAHEASSAHVDGATLATFLRMSIWAERDEWLSPISRWARMAGGPHYHEFFDAAVNHLRAPTNPQGFDAFVRDMAALTPSIRFRSLLLQLLVEAHTRTGEEELALIALEEIVGRCSFIDSDWMDRSPSTNALRSDARFQRLAEIVRDRAESIWTVL